MIGSTISHYRILEEIGRGGMGEVYLAHDEKLDRSIALKILPADMAADPEKLARFQREARSVAALNHPNVVALYSVEEAEGRHFLTMELVRGKPLTEHLRENGLGFDEFLEIAVPLSDALAEAHELGIVHRDLKPANVMIDTNGRVKLLDFGLAKMDPGPKLEDLSSEAETAARTSDGVILGTVPYMSPEQIEGRPVDPRSDIFALGILMFEMATGQRPFRGTSSISVLSSILKDEPPSLRELKADLRPQLSSVIHRCLAKRPDDRYKSGRDLSNALASLSDSPIAVQASATRAFVGREDERALLRKTLANVADGRGAIVLIGGEPGVGKTRLANELLAESRALGLLTLSGHCYEEGAAPLVPIVEVVEQLIRDGEGPVLRRALGASAAEVAKVVPELRQHYEDIPQPMELPPEQQRRALFNAILDFFESLSAGKPVVVLFDDIHWADESTLGLLKHMASHAARLPLLIVGTYRDIEPDVSKAFEKTVAELARKPQVVRLALKRLPESAVTQLLQLLAGSDPPGAFAHTIYSETEGNPFFVRELYEHLAEEGKLFDEAGDWKSDLDSQDLDVPVGVRHVIERRMERLGESTSRVLTTAAVVGRVFELRLVEAACKLDEEAFLEAVEEAERAKLIVVASHSREASYTFTHELIRHTLMESLSLLRRQRLHLRVAERIEELFSSALESRASDLAHHFHSAGSSADVDQTLSYLVLAGDRALASGAPDEAVRQFDRALCLKAEDAGLLFKRGLAYEGLGYWDETAQDWERALPMYEADGHREQVSRICWGLAFQRVISGRTREAREIAQRGLIAVGDEVSTGHARLLAFAGWASARDLRKGLELSDRAVAMAESLGDERVLGGEVLYSRMFLLWHHLMGPDMEAVGNRAIALTRKVGSPLERSRALGIAQVSWSLTGNLEYFDRYLEESEALALREVDLATQLTNHMSRNFVAVARGELGEGERAASRAIEYSRKLRWPWISFQYFLLGITKFWRGNWAEAQESMEDAVRTEPGGAYVGWAQAHDLLVNAYVDGVLEEERVQEASALLPYPGGPTGAGPWFLTAGLVEALATVGLRDEAAKHYPLLTTLLDRGTVMLLSLGLTERIAGIAAHAAGDWPAAEAHFENVLRFAGKVSHRVELPNVRRSYAQMLLERNGDGDRDRARVLLGEAVDEYRQLGMPRHVVLAEDLMKEYG